MDRRITHFHSPFKAIQIKGRIAHLLLLETKKFELYRMEREGHIVKLDKSDEDCFINPIVITSKKDGENKLALDSKPIEKKSREASWTAKNMAVKWEKCAIFQKDFDEWGSRSRTPE